MSEHTEAEMKEMLGSWRPPDAPVEAKSSFVAPSGSGARFDLVEALKEINRHIEALEQIGGCGVTTSVISARDERIEIVRALTLLPPNAAHQPQPPEN